MRIANRRGRLLLAREAGFVDVAERSGERFGPNPQSIYERWDEFRAWAATADLDGGEEVAPAELAAPVPSPRQSLGVALNYRTPGAPRPDPPVPVVFAKFPSCLAGPDVDVTLPSDLVDYEVELVCVIGRATAGVGEAEAWDHVAGVMVGQDLTDRNFLGRDPSGQLSLPKSWPGFGPTGPWVVTSDEPGVRGELELECVLGGERVQHDTTAAMIFSTAQLIAKVSAVCPLLPGDLLFTGTPSGIGMSREPPRYLRDGDVMISRIVGVGEIIQRFHAPR